MSPEEETTAAAPREVPRLVALVAKTHALVGSIVLLSTMLLWAVTRNLKTIEFGARTYAWAGSLAGLYLISAALVWFGLPPGRLLSRVCGLLYLARPNFGSYLWDIMSSPEYRAYFQSNRTDGSRRDDRKSYH